VLLYRWQGAARNFGDELNTLLWPRLLPGFFDGDPAQLFLGIGSVLDDRHPASALKVVAGAGFGGYEGLPALDATWTIHWVRGPRTASRLGLPIDCGIGDPAMLLPLLGWAAGDPKIVGFMPHFESMARGAWAEAAGIAGVELIDPRGDPAAIVGTIGRCRLLLAEALHGAIVADALRIPWVALRPIAPIHRAKWRDWADALDVDVRFQPIPASCLPERLFASPIAAYHRGRRLLDNASAVLARVARRMFLARAANALAAAATMPGQLSPAAALQRCQTRMQESLECVRRQRR
jgi:succinoglycan biosynthesis protein ExoV